MQSVTLDAMTRELPLDLFDGASTDVRTMGIPALAHLAWAVREQRVSDGYRRLLRAIRDESWSSSDD